MYMYCVSLTCKGKNTFLTKYSLLVAFLVGSLELLFGRLVLRGLLVAVGWCNTQVRLNLIYVPGQPPRPPVPGIL